MYSWYVVDTYSGHENKVKANLEHRHQSMRQEERIHQIVVPKESVVETKDGKKVTTERRVFPGYILVPMELNDDRWSLVKNTPGVTGFVGGQDKPVALSRDEVNLIMRTASVERPSRRPSSRSARSCGHSGPLAISPAKSSRSTSTRAGSRSWCRSSAGRPRSSSPSTRSRRRPKQEASEATSGQESPRLH